MTQLFWKCPNCKANNPMSSINDPCPECGDGAKRTPVQMSDIEPIRMKAKGKNKWLYRGRRFQSSDEAWRYGYLMDKQAEGVIRHLAVQPTMVIRDAFELTNPFYIKRADGKPRSIENETYTPDYAYLFDKYLVIEDVKGMSKGKPYSKSDSTRSQKHLLSRYKDRHHVVFMLTCFNKGEWCYFQQSLGYPELSFTLETMRLEKASGE